MNVSLMDTVTIKIGTREEMIEKTFEAVRTREPQGRFVVFTTYDDFARTITGNRLRMIEALIKADEGMTVRALAKKLGRNLRGVHDDLKQLAIFDLVVIERGNIHVPYKDLHIDVHITRAA